MSNPGTLVGFGDFKNPSTILTIIGIVIMAILMAKKVKRCYVNKHDNNNNYRNTYGNN
ncbi:MAG: hypothetical protein ACFWTK_10905 [Clostridium sp.]